MTENKRFKVYKVIGRFHEWSIEDTVDDKVVFDSIIYKYSADKLCNKLNELNDENEQLKSVNMEYEDALGRLEEENDELKETIKTICKDYENYHGMDIRNAEWFTAW